MRLIYYYQSLDIESTNTPSPFLLAVLAMGIVGIEIGEIIYVLCMYINFKIGIKYHMVECVMLNVNDKS